MRKSGSLLIFLSIAACSTTWAAANDASSRPRGVGPEFAKFYKDTTTFSCISHPAIKIPFSAVNDDYCDCPDGSDEPGTAACAHLSRHSPSTPSDHPWDDDIDLTPALPGFYCKNKGHRPSYLPFQRVNDGVCDYEVCCDGSDEWARVGGTKCEDRCKEIGKEWRKLEEKRQKSLTTALKKKKELVAEARRTKKEIEDHIADLETEAKAQELKIQGLEADLERVQKEERSKVVKGKKKGKVNVLAGLAKNRVEELRNALVDVKAQRDESRSRVQELEEILAKFKVEYNPNFNDEGVKRAVRSWEEYAARGTSGEGEEAAKERDLDEISKPDSEASGINWEQWENEEEGESEVDIVYKLAAYLPPSLVSYIEDRLASLKEFLVTNGILAESDLGSYSESSAVTEARDALNAAKSSLTTIRNTMNDHKSDLEKEYGPNAVFRPLKGRCITKDAGEYTYEHCFLDRTKQIPKKGGSSALMGNFVRFGTVIIDELNSSGELVPVERTSLEYANGQSCWNGPARSTTVILECGEEDEILKIAEDEKCVYSMVATTPAVCDGEENGDSSKKEKDEL